MRGMVSRNLGNVLRNSICFSCDCELSRRGLGDVLYDVVRYSQFFRGQLEGKQAMFRSIVC